MLARAAAGPTMGWRVLQLWVPPEELIMNCRQMEKARRRLCHEGTVKHGAGIDSHWIMGKSWEVQQKEHRLGRWSSDSTPATSGEGSLPPSVFPWPLGHVRPWHQEPEETPWCNFQPTAQTALAGDTFGVLVNALSAPASQLALHPLLLLSKKRHRWVPHPLGQKLSWTFLPDYFCNVIKVNETLMRTLLTRRNWKNRSRTAWSDSIKPRICNRRPSYSGSSVAGKSHHKGQPKYWAKIMQPVSGVA